MPIPGLFLLGTLVLRQGAFAPLTLLSIFTTTPPSAIHNNRPTQPLTRRHCLSAGRTSLWTSLVARSINRYACCHHSPGGYDRCISHYLPGHRRPSPLLGGSLDIESTVTPVFATLIFDNIIGLLKSIRRLNRATMSSAPDGPQKNYTASDEPFRYTGSSTGRSAVCIINDQYSQNQISNCLIIYCCRDLRRERLLSRRKRPSYLGQLVCQCAGYNKVAFSAQ